LGEAAAGAVALKERIEDNCMRMSFLSRPTGVQTPDLDYLDYHLRDGALEGLREEHRGPQGDPRSKRCVGYFHQMNMAVGLLQWI